MATFDLENPRPQVGDALRDEAANLLSYRYGRPQSEKLVLGKKVDLFFSRRDFGREVRVYVEAKDYEKRLTREDVVRIWMDYEQIVKRNSPACLLLVTRNGLSPAADKYISEEHSDIRHQTIWELENETMGLAPYVREMKELFDLDGLADYYVEARVREALYDDVGANRRLSGDTAVGFDSLQAWIESDDPRPVAVLGGYGAGKSSLAKRLIAAQAVNALGDPLARRPVLIPLGRLSRYSSLEGLLSALFTHEHPIDGFNLRQFLDMNEKGRLLLVLDGFDEMKHAMTWSDFRSQIEDLNRLTCGRAKVILLGRPSAFTSADEHILVLRGLKRWEEGWRRLPGWPQFIEYELEPFSPAERSDFVARYLKYLSANKIESRRPEWISERVSEVNRLADADPDIFSKPVHAKILTDLAADPNVDLSGFSDRVTRWGLYDLFFTSLAERECSKDARKPITEEGRLSFLREVAYWLWTENSGATSFRAADIPDRIVVSVGTMDAPDLDAAKREYLTGSVLEKKSGDLYHFGHRSFAEFLVAQRMVQRAPKALEHSSYSGITRDGVLAFLQEAPRRANINSWIETLSSAQGVIHLEYIAYVANRVGGVDKLKNSLIETSIWLPILEAIGHQVELNDASPRRIAAFMRTENANLFFVLMRLLQYAVPLSRTSPHGAMTIIAAALLDRVFVEADVDEESRVVRVIPERDAARSLAQSVLSEFREQFGERMIIFKGRRLAQAIELGLRDAGFEVALHPPAVMATWIDDVPLRWDAVVEALPSDTRGAVRDHFRRLSGWSGIFTPTTRQKLKFGRVRGGR